MKIANHSSPHPAWSQGFTRATAEQMHIDILECVKAYIVDVRPADEFAEWYLKGSHNFPAATPTLKDLAEVRSFLLIRAV